MVRTAKKENEATLEEKLAQALVPEGEQPYSIPKNWCWTRLNYLLTASKAKTEDFSDPATKYIGLENIEKDGGIISYAFAEGIKSLKNIFVSGQILYGKLRPYLNKHAVAFFNGVCSTDILVFDSNQAVLNKYIDYYFNLQLFIEYTVSNSQGINLPRVSESTVLNAICPLPPVAEQKRIVDLIESLFSKLDDAKEKAQLVVDGFEERKLAILHKAFTGKLINTKKISNESKFQNWKHVALKDIVSGFKYGTSEKSDYSYTGIPVLRIPNIGDDGIDFTDIKYLSSNNVELSNQIHENDILIVRSNGSRDLVGKCALVPQLNRKYAYGSFLIRIVPSEQVRADYLVLFLNSSDARNQMFSKAKSSAGINNINSKELGAISLNLPSLQEQEEIVLQLRKLLLREEQSKDNAERTIAQIDMIKKSILARAFRGELGTNDPSDENAEGLLRQALENKSKKVTLRSSLRKKIIVVEQMNKSILEVLKMHDRISPENLKRETGLNVDDFYSELKKLIENNEIKETRSNHEVFLEMNNEN